MSLVYYNGKGTLYADSIICMDNRVHSGQKIVAINSDMIFGFVGLVGPAQNLLQRVAAIAKDWKGNGLIGQIFREELRSRDGFSACILIDRRGMVVFWQAEKTSSGGELCVNAPFFMGYEPARHALQFGLGAHTEESICGTDPDHEWDIFHDVVDYWAKADADQSVAAPTTRLSVGELDVSHRGGPAAPELMPQATLDELLKR